MEVVAEEAETPGARRTKTRQGCAMWHCSPGKHRNVVLAPFAPTCTSAWAAHELPALALPAVTPQSVPVRRALPRSYHFGPVQEPCTKAPSEYMVQQGGMAESICTQRHWPRHWGLPQPACKGRGACHAHRAPAGTATVGAGVSPAQWGGALPHTAVPGCGTESRENHSSMTWAEKLGHEGVCSTTQPPWPCSPSSQPPASFGPPPVCCVSPMLTEMPCQSAELRGCVCPRAAPEGCSSQSGPTALP